jgi:hypothetical protein
LLEEAFSWHDAFRKKHGTMKDACAEHRVTPPAPNLEKRSL